MKKRDLAAAMRRIDRIGGTLQRLWLDGIREDIRKAVTRMRELRPAMQGEELHETMRTIESALDHLRRASEHLRGGRDHGFKVNLTMARADLRMVRGRLHDVEVRQQ